LDFHQIPAAFSDSAHAREDIMRASLTKAAQSRSRGSFDSVIYVGDGVWDARAARNLGCGFIGISRDPAGIERLYVEGACHVFRDYLDADSFITILRDFNHVA
jgi:phosphoglycolate phosphatase-like HAD superfamily hydrolase